MKLVDNSCYIWFQQAFNGKVVIARYLMQYLQIFSSFLLFCYYFTRLKAPEISCKIWETRKIFSVSNSAPCNSNYLERINNVSSNLRHEQVRMFQRK